jgi:hypothetical protein
MRPSPPLHHHPEHCSTIPGAVGAQNDKTSPYPLLRVLQPSLSPTLELTYGRRQIRGSHTTTLELLLDRHRTRHDAPPEARFARTANHSTTRAPYRHM